MKVGVGIKWILDVKLFGSWMGLWCLICGSILPEKSLDLVRVCDVCMCNPQPLDQHWDLGCQAPFC